MKERGVQRAERQGPGERSVAGGPQRREQQGTGPSTVFLGKVDGTAKRLPGSLLPGVRPTGQRVCARPATHGEPAETPRTQRGASSHSKVTLPQSPPTGFSCVLRKYRSVTLEIPVRRPCTTGRSGGSGQLPPVLGHVRMCSLSCLVRSGPLDTLSQ